LCSFLQFPVASSLFGSDILLNTLFSDTLSPCSSLYLHKSRLNFEENCCLLPYRHSILPGYVTHISMCPSSRGALRIHCITEYGLCELEKLCSICFGDEGASLPVSDVDCCVIIVEILGHIFYTRQSFAGGKIKYAYREFLFHKVVYTTYDVPSFLEQIEGVIW
jgi:hypothetical protein